jgi:hypothetical protein
VSKFGEFLEYKDALPPKEKKRWTSMMCCHRCLKVCSQKDLKFCDLKVTSVQTDSYTTTDYFSFRKSNLEGDYFYDAKEQQHVIPYFEYNKDSVNQKLTCNRAFCDAFIESFINSGDKKFSCIYCKGLCTCLRCEKAVGLVKIIALDYHNDPYQEKEYHETFKLFGMKEQKDVSETFNLRMPNDEVELKYLE